VKIRILSGIIGGILFLFLMIQGGFLLSLAIGFLSLLATREIWKIMDQAGVRLSLPLAFFFNLVLMIGETILWSADSPRLSSGSLWGLTFITLLFISFLSFSRKGITQGVFVSLLAQIFVLLYPGLLFTYIFHLRNLAPKAGWQLLLFAFVVIWGTDTGAYFIGSAFGRNHLAPKLSPNKTVEGAVGGLLVGTLAGVFYGSVLQWPFLWSLGTGVLASFAGQVGDLFESFLKRLAGVKDSGHFLPGHGGVLDRFDSALFALPVVYYLALLLFY
jgi:phosphatidate cytidylyltransferase